MSSLPPHSTASSATFTPLSHHRPSTDPARLLHCAAAHPYQLGASLYMPATRQDLWQVISRQKLPTLNSMIICLEDAVSIQDIPAGLHNVQRLLDTWEQAGSLRERPLVFVRPRNPDMLATITSFTQANLLDGFVLPKVDMDSLSSWRLVCQDIDDKFLLMPTLETGKLFDMGHNFELADAIKHGFNERIYALRIGGNDLFSALRLRRPNNETVYQTPIGSLIYQLLGCFVPKGFYLTAPVFEYLQQPSLMMQELSKDVQLGLVGKTVIHPTQIDLVHQAFAVSPQDNTTARAILAADAKAVFKHNDTMLEPATHRAWAEQIKARTAVFGIIG